ncbi:HU family DNA-binding protein [Francisella philomiragia]|uniref:HU family DNA-binding protein n=1 Tax=Francisella philomiragia TaxID=28110 RepID=UPI00190442BA|nr:HU family DNA-binding protein [Francisella philomiragia]MBK2341708.1 HU family DNA-binding protein [Francisella philomiragia]
MNKNELIHEIAKNADVTLETASKCLNAFTDVVTKTLKKKQSITLVGFGTFEAKERSAREGRNPKTGETIKIPATTVPNFKAGKTLKESVK